MPRSLPFPKGRRRNRDASNDPDGENRILQSLSLNDPVLLQPQLKLIDLKRGPVRQAAVAQRPSGSTFGDLTDKLTMFRVTVHEVRPVRSLSHQSAHQAARARRAHHRLARRASCRLSDQAAASISDQCQARCPGLPKVIRKRSPLAAHFRLPGFVG